MALWGGQLSYLPGAREGESVGLRDKSTREKFTPEAEEVYAASAKHPPGEPWHSVPPCSMRST